MEKLMPQIKGMRYFEAVLNRSVRDDENLVVCAKDYVIKLGDLLTKTPKRTLS